MWYFLTVNTSLERFSSNSNFNEALTRLTQC